MSLDTDIQDLLKGDAALLEHRADENIQVKGGLISLHIQAHAHYAVLIKINGCGNTTDKWWQDGADRDGLLASSP
ncbi:poly [ADP-ribose] polymerase tankyrase-2-like [Salmo trutta]|uniref:poly [ADP-ribose] polymerase tankyrase-2-like n=1 Tax=Salmo trutta TaxID=8032 RepID=UPI001130113E|nr:poly [ADP-ribose] polymerase tankyrase-2-like [Salmo trutta]